MPGVLFFFGVVPKAPARPLPGSCTAYRDKKTKSRREATLPDREHATKNRLPDSMAAVMAQPAPMEINGVPTPDANDFNQHVAPVKRKRDSEDEGATTPNTGVFIDL